MGGSDESEGLAKKRVDLGLPITVLDCGGVRRRICVHWNKGNGTRTAEA
jgi:hypothetical protein